MKGTQAVNAGGGAGTRVMDGLDAVKLMALLKRLVVACERIADRAAESDPATRRGGQKPRPACEAVEKPDDAGTTSFPRDLQLPPEVGTAQAAEILGVSKDTVIAYKRKGLLPFRDQAPPGSTKPLYMFPLDAVMQMRTTYQTEEPAQNVPRELPRRRMKGRRQFKHLVIDDEA